MPDYVRKHTTQSFSDSPEDAVEYAIRGIGASGDESNFKEGFSWDQIDFIRVQPREKAGVLKAFKDLNMTHLPDGRPVEKIITTSATPLPRKWRKKTWEPVNGNG